MAVYTRPHFKNLKFQFDNIFNFWNSDFSFFRLYFHSKNAWYRLLMFYFAWIYNPCLSCSLPSLIFPNDQGQSQGERSSTLASNCSFLCVITFFVLFFIRSRIFLKEKQTQKVYRGFTFIFFVFCLGRDYFSGKKTKKQEFAL